MRENFIPSLKYTLLYEGGKVDDPADPGGRTNKGITQNTYNTYLKWRGRGKSDVYNITQAEVEDIYLTMFWLKCQGDTLPIGPDFAVFDYGVNSGPSRAVKAIPSFVQGGVEEVKTICANRASFVNAIRNFSKFRKGVLARIAKVEVIAVTMALSKLPSASVRPKLQDEAAKAQAHQKRASAGAGSVTAGTAITVPTAPTVAVHNGLPGWSIWLIAIGILALIGLVVYLVYRSKVHGERAIAYEAAAKVLP